MTTNSIPAYWTSISLEEIASFIDYRGKTPIKTTSGVPLITAKNIRNGYISAEPREYIAESDYTLWMTRGIPQHGDVLITTEAPLGNIARIDIREKFALAQRAICLQTYFKETEGWMYFSLRSPQFQLLLSDNSTGTTVKGIKAATLKLLEIPLPPLAEQKQIAAKLDELLAQVDTIKTRLDAIPHILKRFRQSVLSAAVSGKLTEEWRKTNTQKTDVLGIRDEHANLMKKKHGRYNAPSQLNEASTLPELPISWCWFRAEEICDLITKGTTPSKEKMASTGDIPYIKVYNLRFDGKLDFAVEPTFISHDTHSADLARSKVYPGDVLMNIVGPPLGKVSIVPEIYSEWNINQAIAIFRPVCGVSNRYLSLCLRDHFLLDATIAKAKATAGQFNLTLEICRDFSVPVPPLEEQTEIVRRVEQLFAFADQIEQRVKDAQSRVNHLTQSILAKAFRGELTADWRAQNLDLITGENSAEALLARIRAEREANTGTTKPRKRKAST